MAIDLSKIVKGSNYPGFENTNKWSGSFTLGGTCTDRMKTITSTVNLSTSPDLLDVVISGRRYYTGVSSRPDNAYFKVLASTMDDGLIGVPGSDHEVPFIVTYSLSGSILTFTAIKPAEQYSYSSQILTDTTVYYRIIDYTVPAGVNFLSSKNYLKSVNHGSDSIDLGGSSAIVTKTINHNLGYIPMVSVGSNLDDNTKVWSSNNVGTSIYGDISFYDHGPQISYLITTTQLIIKIKNSASPASGSRTVWWKIYGDYSA